MEQKLRGIDISEFNGRIDFSKIKTQVDYVYIRATYGRYGIDKRFKEYAKGCLDNQIPFSFYYYSYATDVKKAEEEVNFFIDTIKEYKENITFPLCIDMEDSDGYKVKNGNPEKEILTEICLTACTKIAENKFVPVIYANADWFKNRLDKEKLKDKLKWLAWWNTEEKNVDKTLYCMWQYSSKGSLAGIESKNVDLNYSFVDFNKLKLYTENVSKINFIKSKTLFSDIVIQFISCYKFGQDLLNKLYKGLSSDEKLVYKELTFEDKKKEIKKYFGFEQKTIDYLSNFIYAEDFFRLLYNAICGNLLNIKE